VAEDTEGMEFIASVFAGVNDGVLVDVGAHNGDEAGNMSRQLVLRGWRGIMIEPLKVAYANLHKLYRGNKNVVCIECACSDRDGTAPFYPSLGVSTLEKAWADECAGYWKHVTYGASYTVRLMRLDGILAEVRRVTERSWDVDYLQIDTEGHDFAVLRGMDWSHRPRVICVETLDMMHRERHVRGVWEPDPQMHEYIVSKGYDCAILTQGGNGIYVRKGVS